MSKITDRALLIAILVVVSVDFLMEVGVVHLWLGGPVGVP